MTKALRLRVIEGGIETRGAVAAAPDLPPQNAPDRLPQPPAPFEGVRLLAGVVVALAVHAGLLAYAMYQTGDEEALAAGGSESIEVIEGISIITLDSVDSQFSDGASELPEAMTSPDTPPTEPLPEAAAVVPEAVAVTEPTAMAAVVTDDTPVVAAAAPVETIAPLPEAVAAVVSDVEESVQPADSDAPVQPTEEAPVATAVEDAPEAAVAEETVVAARDITPPPPDVKPDPPRPAPQPPRQAKPAPKPEKPAPAPARRAPDSSASVAEQAARGPKPGTAGAGGASTTERGKANLSSYQAKLVAQLRRHRTYPAAARSKGLRGTAIVTFTVNASGAVTRASLAKSSGHAILDEAAVQMVHRASPFPPIPANIGQSSLTVSAPVRFDAR